MKVSPLIDSGILLVRNRCLLHTLLYLHQCSRQFNVKFLPNFDPTFGGYGFSVGAES